MFFHISSYLSFILYAYFFQTQCTSTMQAMSLIPTTLVG